MKCKVLLFSVTSSLLLSVSVSSVQADYIGDRATLDALLGGNQIFEDFESYLIAPGAFDILFGVDLDSTSVLNGQGPGLVEPGAIYVQDLSSPVNDLVWFGDTAFGLESKAIGRIQSTTFEIMYSTAVTAMGLDLRSLINFGGFVGTADVYDTNDVLVSSTDIEIVNGGAENLFFGWEHAAGIGRVLLTGSPNKGGTTISPIIDNHGYGQAIPAPGALALLGVAGLMGRRRRRRNA